MTTSPVRTLLVALAALTLGLPALAHDPAGNWHRSFPGGDHAIDNGLVAHAAHVVRDCSQDANEPGMELQAQTVAVGEVVIVQLSMVTRVLCGNDGRPCPRGGGWLVATVIVNETTREIPDWSCG